jgi:hypothetical protein
VPTCRAWRWNPLNWLAVLSCMRAAVRKRDKIAEVKIDIEQHILFTRTFHQQSTKLAILVAKRGGCGVLYGCGFTPTFKDHLIGQFHIKLQMTPLKQGRCVEEHRHDACSIYLRWRGMKRDCQLQDGYLLAHEQLSFHPVASP